MPLLAGSNPDEPTGSTATLSNTKYLELDFFSRNPEGVLDPNSEYPRLVQPGAAHGAEIVYAWGRLVSQSKPWQPWDHQLRMMSSCWVNFARTGDPSGPGLPAWSAYDASKDQLMHFSDKVRFGEPSLNKAMEAADGYYSGE